MGGTTKFADRAAFFARSFISVARSQVRRRKRPAGNARTPEIFDRRRDAAVSFISRQEQDPRAGRFAREQDLRETLSSRAICHRLFSPAFSAASRRSLPFFPPLSLSFFFDSVPR